MEGSQRSPAKQHSNPSADLETLIPKQASPSFLSAESVVEPAATASEPASSGAVKWGGLLLLVLQNSSVFVVTRYTRIAKGRLYLPSVVLLIVELFKLLICVVLISREAAHSPRALAAYLYESVWVQRKSTMLLGGWGWNGDYTPVTTADESTSSVNLASAGPRG